MMNTINVRTAKRLSGFCSISTNPQREKPSESNLSMFSPKKNKDVFFFQDFLGKVVLGYRIFVDGGSQTNGTATWRGRQTTWNQKKGT